MGYRLGWRGYFSPERNDANCTDGTYHGFPPVTSAKAGMTGGDRRRPDIRR